ncbi:MAG TPA: septum formation initiator family protein [Parcubacteria group bacterium]|jgi:cell division protein FtsB|nr:septum formation initiator family protein [Parcubacteria group bacterium]
MLDIQQKRRFRNFVYNRVTLGFLLVIVLLALHSTWRVYLKKRESVEMMESSYLRLSELEKRDMDLELKINKLNTVSGLEEEIRSKFSVAKDNENTVIIVREEGASSSEIVEKESFWSKIKSLFR